MIKFRNETPCRRKNPKKVKYTAQKEPLKEDFNSRCGYCDDCLDYKKNWFEIDHFVPKNKLKTISEDEYSNLVFSCRLCNNSKRHKWPTNDELIHNSNDEGFIDPCDPKFDLQFSRNNKGQILPITKLGRWMHKELKLYKSEHEIIWMIEQLDSLIIEIKKTCEAKNLKCDPKLFAAYELFHEYIQKLNKTC